MSHLVLESFTLYDTNMFYAFSGFFLPTDSDSMPTLTYYTSHFDVYLGQTLEEPDEQI